MMTQDGNVSFNGKGVQMRDIRKLISTAHAESTNQENATVAIVAEVGVPWKRVSDVMEIASDLKLRAIIATQPKE